MEHDTFEGFPLSPQQRLQWFLQQDPVYFLNAIHGRILVEGELDIAVFQAALAEVINHHEILRTTFRSLPGLNVPLQCISGASPFSVHHFQLSELSSQEQEQKIAALINETMLIPFDYERGPLLQLTLLTLAPQKHILAIRASTLCLDATSIPYLLQEISAAYALCLEHKEWAETSLQYADIAAWENELLESEEAAQGRAYWASSIPSDVCLLRLPGEASSVENRPSGDAHHTIELDEIILAQIETCKKRFDTSLPLLLLACWHTLLWRLGNKPESVVVGVAYDGRKYAELENIPGPLTKYLPLHCRFEEQTSFRELLECIKTVANDAYTWQEYFTWEHHQQILAQAGVNT